MEAVPDFASITALPVQLPHILKSTLSSFYTLYTVNWHQGKL